ncbi:MAG: AbrB/MazE/SpoVT family DNA-binding domain-containing protein [Planctomycetota bacterium]
MPLVRVKDKYQVTLPADIRRAAGLAVGDFLEVEVDRGKITLTPKALVERELALALEDVQRGRVHGPFGSADELVRSLRSAVRKPARATPPRRKPKRTLRRRS